MPKEIFKINKKKDLKEIVSGGKNKEPKKEAIIIKEEPVIVEQVSVASPEKKKGFFESKVRGAIAEIFRRKELDETVETNLSQGLESNPEFVAASQKIDKKRNWINSVYHKYISKQLESDEIVSVEEIEKEMALTSEELEDSLVALGGEHKIETNNETQNETQLELAKETEAEPVFVSPFNEKVSKYAENIGIKAEELATNQEFLSLSPEQQKFALETLRRSSLAKAKAEAHQTFTEEKATKKWWQVGFVMNQNFHKERHKIEAVKNIEKRGLEGYGEAELAWLVDVIKNGPEVKVNDAGEVIVNCLHDDSFTKEQKEIVSRYNAEARKYIEHEPKNKDDDDTWSLKNSLESIQRELFAGADRYRAAEINDLLLKSKNNIELLKFLSVNDETEKILNKMSGTSLTGFDKAKAMALGQKDKAGYSALGFAIRSGTKFAMANSAYLASALSYSVAPMAAAIVGGFRGYNTGKKELIEKEELVKLGIADTSSTAKSLNLATGKKEGQNGGEVRFGLADKLQKLIDNLKFFVNDPDNYKDEIDKTVKELNLRISYTEKQIDRDDVDYGPINERNANYFNLINTLAEAKSAVGVSASHIKYQDYQTEFDTNGLTRYGKKIDLAKLGLEKEADESEEDYQTRLSQNKEFNKYKKWVNDEKRLEALSKLSVEDRLASFMDYKDDKQSKKELNFLLKKAATGALMGASFAAIGAFVAEHVGIGSWLSNKSDAGNVVDTNVTASNIPETNIDADADADADTYVDEPAVVEDNAVEVPTKSTPSISTENIEPEEVITERLESAPTPELEVPEIAEVKAPEIVAPTIDTNTVTPPEVPTEITPEVVTQEQVLPAGITVEVEPTNIVETPVVVETPEVEVSAPILEPQEVAEVAPIEINPEALPTVEVTETPVVIQEAQEVLDAKKAADTVKNLIDVDNKATRLVDKIYSNSPEFRTEEAFLKQLSINNNGAKLSAVEESYAKSTWESFKSNGDYNSLKRRVISLAEGIYGRVGDVKDIVEVENVETESFVADKIAIAEELHTKPESLEQVGGNLIYKGAGQSNLVFDLKAGGIKEGIDINGKKIPKEFIDELIDNKKLAKFTRGGGLDKIFTSWNKLGSNDRLMYDSLSWFNKKTMNPEDLLTQIKGLYHVDTEKVFIDGANKKFITSNGKTFDMTLKGIKKLVAFLPNK